MAITAAVLNRLVSITQFNKGQTSKICHRRNITPACRFKKQLTLCGLPLTGRVRTPLRY